MKEGVETRADRANMGVETVSTNRLGGLSYRIVFIFAIQELNSMSLAISEDGNQTLSPFRLATFPTYPKLGAPHSGKATNHSKLSGLF